MGFTKLSVFLKKNKKTPLPQNKNILFLTSSKWTVLIFQLEMDFYLEISFNIMKKQLKHTKLKIKKNVSFDAEWFFFKTFILAIIVEIGKAV